MKLHELAHTRSGDKGNTLNIALICYDAKHYEHLRTRVTATRVKEFLSGIVLGEVVRYELPQLAAFNFVLSKALGGGVTRSLVLDAHGKTLSSALLALDIDAPPINHNGLAPVL